MSLPQVRAHKEVTIVYVVEEGALPHARNWRLTPTKEQIVDQRLMSVWHISISQNFDVPSCMPSLAKP